MKRVTTIFGACLFLNTVQAQEPTLDSLATKTTAEIADTTETAKPTLEVLPKKQTPGKNIFKINLGSLTVKNYSFMYERALGKHTSIAVGYRFMPKGSLPFQSNINDIVGDNSVAINRVAIGNNAITGEFRWYPGKRGWMRGFYVAPYVRQASFDLSVPVDFSYTVTVPSPGGPIIVPRPNEATFTGKITSFSGGLMLGTQYTFGKFITLDIWIIGGHYGSSNGDLTFRAANGLDAREQQELKAQLEKIEFPTFKFESTVDANGGTVKSTGGWAGLRGLGFNLGIRF
ncbi:MAG: hypothetical protein ACK4HE_00510 [Chitinophagaceae bacterium]